MSNAITKICDLDDVKFEVLQKIIKILSDCEYFCIRNGKIEHFINHIIVSTDLSSILGDDFNIDIVNPKKYAKLLKPSNKSKNFELLEDNFRYILTSGNVKVFLPKKANLQLASIGDIKLSAIGSTIEISDNKQQIKNIIGTGEVTLIINDNKFKGLLSPDGQYTFEDYLDDEFSEEDSDLLIAYGFMIIDANSYKFQVGKRKQSDITKSDEYWLFTSIKIIDDIEFNMLENLVKKNLTNIF